MNAGVLTVPKEMARVSRSTFEWFVKTIEGRRTINYSNAHGHYSDNYLVAAEVFREKEPMYFVQTKKSKGAK